MGEELYNPSEESSYLQYLDANNLYGWAMSQELPTHDFKWREMTTLEKFTPKSIAKLVKKNKHGYLLEVDVDYPSHLHKNHNDLPFLPQRMTIRKVEKLVPNLRDKRKIVVQIRALGPSS